MEEIFPKHEQEINEIFKVLDQPEMETMILSLKKVGLQLNNKKFLRKYLEFEINRRNIE